MIFFSKIIQRKSKELFTLNQPKCKAEHLNFEGMSSTMWLNLILFCHFPPYPGVQENVVNSVKFYSDNNHIVNRYESLLKGSFATLIFTGFIPNSDLYRVHSKCWSLQGSFTTLIFTGFILYSDLYRVHSKCWSLQGSFQILIFTGFILNADL